jgi:hypothetical protein
MLVKDGRAFGLMNLIINFFLNLKGVRMKSLTASQIEAMQIINGWKCEVSFTPYPVLDFGGYGFEATEEYEGEFSGFRFFGPTHKQAQLIGVWNSLTVEHSNDPMLTVERAKALIGKRITVYYNDVNNGTIDLRIAGIEVRQEKQIGQTETTYLLFTEYEDGKEMTPYGGAKYKDYIYEWQGIFRVGGGAERLFIKKIEVE